LHIDPRGVDEGDFVFLLGYPGRTYRHQAAAFVELEEQVRMPFVADLYDWQIDVMEAAGKTSPGINLKLASAIKGRANVMKNYRGKLLGLKRLGLVDRKRAEEAELARWIAADGGRRARYGGVLEQIEKIYKQLGAATTKGLMLSQLVQGVSAAALAREAYAYAQNGAKPEAERDAAFDARNEPERREARARRIQDAVPAVDQQLLARALRDAAALPEAQRFGGLERWRQWMLANANEHLLVPPNEERLATWACERTQLLDVQRTEALMTLSKAELLAVQDPFVQLIACLASAIEAEEEEGKVRRGELDRLMALYVEAKQTWKGADFCPDANGTLRLTHGRVRRYQPRDGVVYTPITTLGGVVEKATGLEPFDAPEELIKLWQRRDFGDFAHPELGDVPVAILYDTDTSGGNSGSPILNAKGDVVGVNFDRSFEATINDFQWSVDYSRSIGVDIRYVLWVTQKLMHADAVLEELRAR
jgi:hypothetical protein